MAPSPTDAQIQRPRAAAPAGGPRRRQSQPTAEPAAWRVGVAVAGALVLLTLPLVVRGGTDEIASWSFAASGIAALLAVLAASPRAVPRSLLIGLGALIALACWYLITSSWALLPGGSVIEGVRILSLAMAIVVGYVAAGRPRGMFVVLAAIGIAALAVAGHAGLPVLVDGLGERREAGWLGYRNATALCAAICALGGVLLTGMSRLSIRLLASPIAALAGLCVVATASRGALLAVAAGVVWLLLVRGRDARLATLLGAGVVGAVLLSTIALEGNPVGAVAAVVFAGAVALALLPRVVATLDTPKRRRGLAMLGAAMVLIVGIAVAPAVPNAAREFTSGKINDTGGAGRLVSIGASTRWVWWKESASQWAQRPVRGWGGQAFSVRRGAGPREYVPAQRPHSLVLQLGIEGGAVAVILGALVAVALLAGIWSAGGAALAGTIVVAAGAQELFDWTFELAFVTAVVGLCVGVASRPGRERDATRARQPGHLPVSPQLTIAACALLCLLPASSFVLLRGAERALAAGKPGVAGTRARHSNQLVPSSGALLTEVTALELTRGSGPARRRLYRGLGQLHYDVSAWELVGDFARDWHDERLAQFADGRLRALRPDGVTHPLQQ